MLVKNYRGGEKWLDGVITDVLVPVTYLVSVNGTCVKRHVNQMLDVVVSSSFYKRLSELMVLFFPAAG